MKIFVATVLLMIAASTIFYIMVVSPKVAGLSEDEVIKVTTIDNNNIRLTMSVEKGWVHLGENLVINFEVSNEGADNVWLNGTSTHHHCFYFNVYDENHVKIGMWPRPELCWVCACSSCPWGPVPPGEFYSENLVWDLAAYSENYDDWPENCRIYYLTSSATVEVCPIWWPEYERVELGPGTYYLEGHAGYTKRDTYWINFELVTPLLKITILPSESI